MRQILIIAAITGIMTAVPAQDVTPEAAQPQVLPAAILAFQERGLGAKGLGSKASDILFASLVSNPDMYLIDREELGKTLAEQELNLSGMVSPGQAIQVGQLTGAKVLITGSVIEAGPTLYVVAKIIGTETSRVLGASVKGNMSDDYSTLVEQLAEKVAKTVLESPDKLVVKIVKTKDRIADLKEKLGDAERPSVTISVQERHVGQSTVDPSAQTELILFCKETGFTVIDNASNTAKQSDIIISGEGFSEFASRRGNLVSVKARLEVKAVDRGTGKIIATDRQTAVVVDLTEQIAGKKALQDAAALIAERLLPKLVK